MRAAVLLGLLVLPLPASARVQPGLTIFAAASLSDVMRDVGVAWQGRGHQAPIFVFEASSTLALDIEHGAPAEIFISADEKWMDELAHTGKIDPATRTDLAGNTLVLVERKAKLKPIALKPGADILGLLGPGDRLAVGDPAHVPAGIYARQALEKLGLWAGLSSRLAPAADVRAALALVQHGEAPAAIVYGTDVKFTPGVGVAGTFPADSHDPIRYAIAATPLGATKEGLGFLTFLRTEDAQVVFRHYGFPPP